MADLALRRGVGAVLPLQRVALIAAELAGWRRYGTAFLLGALAVAALPPVDLTPILFVSFSGLVWLAEGNRGGRDAFALGWSFGAGFFVAGLYWIGVALTVDWAQFWWLFPIAELAVPAGLAIFTGLATLAGDLANRHLRLSFTARIVSLAICWVALEYLRGHVLSGFPWNLVGYAWSGGFPGAIAVLQSTSVIGIYGLSFLTVLVAALPASLGDPAGAKPWPALAGLLLVALLAVAGAWRLAVSPRADVAGVTLRLVQPSIPQTLYNDPAQMLTNFRRLMTLSLSPSPEKLSAVIWPEGSAPPFLERDAASREAFAHAAPEGGLVIAGTVRGEPNQPNGAIERYFNSLAVVDRAGSIVATYDKHHLVPFGEYVPFRGVLPINKITPGTVDFTAGPGPRTLDLPGLPPASPLICYEAIFPGEAVDPAHRPQWLLNVTNDAWYGFTSGPFQHLAIARVRAIEQGLPLARAANNGVSAVVDPFGRVTGRLALDAIGVLDRPLPRALAPTIYARFGDSGFVSLLLLGIAAALGITRYERNRHAGAAKSRG